MPIHARLQNIYENILYHYYWHIHVGLSCMSSSKWAIYWWR